MRIESIITTVSLILTCALVGCSDVTTSLTYPKINQGNAFQFEQIKELHLGMSKAEVQALLGSPVLSDSLESHCWHYLYIEQQGSKTIKKQGITLWFDQNDKLKKIEKIQ